MPSTAQILSGPSTIPAAQAKGQGGEQQRRQGDDAFSLLLQQVESIAAEQPRLPLSGAGAEELLQDIDLEALEKRLLAMGEEALTIGSAPAEEAAGPLPSPMMPVISDPVSLPGNLPVRTGGAVTQRDDRPQLGDPEAVLKSLGRDRGNAERPAAAGADVRGPELRPLPQYAAERAADQRSLAEIKLDAMMAARKEQDQVQSRIEPSSRGADAAPASRLDVTAQAQAAAETSNPVVRQVAQNLHYMARGGMERLRIDLFPEELGRVQVQMHKSGTMTRVTIVAESQQAFEALQRGAGGLQHALQQAGFDADEMRFEHREQQDGNRQSSDRDERQRNRDDDERAERRESFARFTGDPIPFN
jgi:hypothetical protein